ncbi:outer membrane protein assembly factor BamA [Brumimicrobium aurantiacum]|uniref:Outer membrane protein assembly factor BamA n=1 Tax=Brumimicrobium aurantiacum TaxID=1737063 RepID=A0A3E1EYA6_9FLAO|nr:outer membrane protein assembly factor BamA [Brumimicrobium aurantiacum]RFC54528.1 outer membrane protein assembly factor BamA [Brumimicrobium aurantiacum]
MRYLTIALVVHLFSQFAFGQQVNYENPKTYEIGPISINGADNFDHQAIKLIAGLRQGEEIVIPGDDISKAIRNLWEEKLFSDVQIKLDKAVGDIAYLSINLKPRPKLSRFKFVGAKKKDADNIREEINLFSGKNITENLIFNTRAKVVGYYREKGFYNVDVNIQRVNDSLMNNSEIFIINIDRGEPVRIAEINFYGVESVKEGKLRRKMKDTKQKAFWRFFKRSKFTESAYARDKNLLLQEFKKIGLRDAKIVHDTVYALDEKNLIIDITIDEGEKYYFGNITWVGNSKYTSGYLDTVLGLSYGDLYNKELLDTRLHQSMDGRDITSLYMDKGHLFFQVFAVETNVEDHHIDYEIRMTEGKEARIKDIIIKGNYKTNDYVIRREIRTKPGDLFNRNDIIRTQRELAQLGYFDEQAFEINPLPNPADGTVDIEYVVTEKSSDQIELSGGYGAGTIIGTLGLTFNNFSIQNTFNKEAWAPLPTGDGQTLSLRGQTNGPYYQSYNFSFTEPWLGGKKPNALTTWVNHQTYSSYLDEDDDLYNKVSISGAGIGLQRRKKIPDDYFSAYYELSYSYYDITNYSSFAFDDGFSNDIAFKYVLARNSIDAPIYPKSGSRISFTAKTTLPYSRFDGISDYSSLSEQEKYKYAEYYKMKLTGEWYLPLTADKKLILSPKVGFGFLGGFSSEKGLTPFERFYLGGNGLTGVNQLDGRELISLRGYESEALSSETGDPLIARYSLELRYPISLNPSATFFVLAFAEAGNTYTGFDTFNPFNVKRSFGGGVRIYLPMFGLLGFDYGWGIDPFDPHSNGYAGGNDLIRRSGKPVGTFQFIIGKNLGDL